MKNSNQSANFLVHMRFLCHECLLHIPFFLLQRKEKKLAQSFGFTFRYRDDVLSLNNSKFGDYVDLIYPIELEIKYTTDTEGSASYLDLQLEIDPPWVKNKTLRKERRL